MKLGQGAAAKAATTVIMLVLALFMVLPFIWMISASLKRPSEIFLFPIEWIPSELRFANYAEVWFNASNPFYLFYWNSIKVTVLSVLGTIAVSAMAAYAFARMNFWGKNALFLAYLATMMIPHHVTLVPRFIIIHWLGIYNTHWALIIPAVFNVLGIFLLRQFFISIPQELSEAAHIDGAGHFRIFSRIVLPLAKPALMSLLILTFVWNWNDYMNPLIFITSKENYTIPLGLQSFLSMEDQVEYNLVMAGATIAILPILIVFVVAQKYFIEGIATSGLKG